MQRNIRGEGGGKGAEGEILAQGGGHVDANNDNVGEKRESGRRQKQLNIIVLHKHCAEQHVSFRPRYVRFCLDWYLEMTDYHN